MKKSNFFIPLLVASVIFSGCDKKEKGAKTNSEQSVPVRIMKVESRDMKKTLDYVGTIKAQDEARVYSKVSGKILEKIKEEGDAVNKGDIIAYVDRDEVGLNYEKAPVESPMNGFVGRVYVDKGSNVNTQTAVVSVVDIDKVEIDLGLPEKYLPRISIGQSASINVDAYPEEIFKGDVSRISPVVDTETRAAQVEIVIQNTGHRLKPGMYARVQLVMEERENVPVVLRESIMGGGDDLYLYVVEDKKAVTKKITTGIRQGNLVEITSGVKKGDSAVIMGQQKLKDGSPVRVEDNARVSNIDDKI